MVKAGYSPGGVIAQMAGTQAELKPLNPEQQAAVEFGDGALMIKAGAGSGKTEVLSRRVLRLIERGVEPWRILLLTFTNKAANNAKERCARHVGPAGRQVWAMTFHSFGVRVLREDGHHIGLLPGFTIYDTDDQERVLRTIIGEEMKLDPKVFKPSTYAALISRLKTELVDARSLADGRFMSGDIRRVERVLRDYGGMESRTVQYLDEIYLAYERAMQSRNAIDFGDCLLKTVRLFRAHPAVADEWANRFRYILVDEYQDTNRAQYALVHRLAQGHGNITVVGDPEQTIMSFQGADRTNMLSFARDFPGAREIRLTLNYRSTEPILAAANAVRAQGQGDGMKLRSVRGPGSRLKRHVAMDGDLEAAFVVRQIEKGIRAGRSPGEFAVLYRTHALSRPFEERLARSRVLPTGIPYVVVGGLRFTDRMEVKDLVAYLKLCRNPRDAEAFRRAVQTPKRGIGAKVIEQVLQVMRERPDIGALDALASVKLTRVASEGATQLRQLYASAPQVEGTGGIQKLVEHFLYGSGYWAMWQRLAENGKPAEREEAQERLDNLFQVVAMAQEMDRDEATFDDFLSRIALSASGDEISVDDAVKLQTLHSAKGLEFPTVFLVALEDDILPFWRAVEEGPDGEEEERRLFYVGITRAEQELYLTRALRRSMRSRQGISEGAPSRFLAWVPEHLQEDVFA